MLDTGIRYPVVPPYEPEQGEVLMERPGLQWSYDQHQWLVYGDSSLPFDFPGTPSQVYQQAMRSIARENFPCGMCGFCLDCLKLELS